MMDFNKTKNWLVENAPSDVQDEVSNLLEALLQHTTINLDALVMMEEVEENIDHPEKLKETINDFKKKLLSSYAELKKPELNDTSVDKDILNLIKDIEGYDEKKNI